jgi:hypothetical protein
MEYQKPRKLYQQGQPITFQDIGLLAIARNSHEFCFNVPIEKCVWGYGWRYAKGEHPLLNFFEVDQSMDEFYQNYQPGNTLEALTLGLDKRFWHSLELPWHFDIESKLDVKERKSGQNQHLGPVGFEKLNYEKYRLNTLIQSIRLNGYDPDKFGYPNLHICGYFLLKDNNFLFYIEGGKHRAIALVELGYTSLPAVAIPEPYFISHNVLSGLAGIAYPTSDLPIVQTIFESYFDIQLRKQRKQLVAEWMRRARGGSVVVF